jgi:hypothetical protein
VFWLDRVERAEIAELQAACRGAPAPRGEAAGGGGRRPPPQLELALAVDIATIAAGTQARLYEHHRALLHWTPPTKFAYSYYCAHIRACMCTALLNTCACPCCPVRRRFERTFKTDVARAAGVQVRRVVVDGVNAGSVVVQFHIAQPLGLAAATQSDMAGQPSSADATAVREHFKSFHNNLHITHTHTHIDIDVDM